MDKGAIEQKASELGKGTAKTVYSAKESTENAARKVKDSTKEFVFNAQKTVKDTANSFQEGWNEGKREETLASEIEKKADEAATTV